MRFMRERVISVDAVVSYYFQERESPIEVKCKWGCWDGDGSVQS